MLILNYAHVYQFFPLHFARFSFLPSVVIFFPFEDNTWEYSLALVVKFCLFFIKMSFLLSFFFFFLFWLHLQHMELPRPGIKSKLWQCWIFNPLCHSGNSYFMILQGNLFGYTIL